MLQRVWGSLNYIVDVYKDLAKDCAILCDRFKKKIPAWTPAHTKVVKTIKLKGKELPCLNIPNPQAYKIVEIDVTDVGYGGMLKQMTNENEQLVRFTSSIWNPAQKNYSTIKKEILVIVNLLKI